MELQLYMHEFVYRKAFELISQMVYFLIIDILWKSILLLFWVWWYNLFTILQMLWQLSCGGMWKKIVAWSSHCENLYCSYFESDDLTNSQFCRCYDSSAVVTCAKLWLDPVIVIYVIAYHHIFIKQHIFLRFGFWAASLFVKQVLDCRIVLSSIYKLEHFTWFALHLMHSKYWISANRNLLS